MVRGILIAFWVGMNGLAIRRAPRSIPCIHTFTANYMVATLPSITTTTQLYFCEPSVVYPDGAAGCALRTSKLRFPFLVSRLRELTEVEAACYSSQARSCPSAPPMRLGKVVHSLQLTATPWKVVSVRLF